MNVLIATFLIGSALGFAPTAQACEKHLDGHQNGSDTTTELQQRSEGRRR
ncbi:MAG: hypothetical protein VKJ05_09140 [Synechococcaceae cyanobacterium]|nr:hypothetical protein [Synechococcaceae cyanobacterium]